MFHRIWSPFTGCTTGRMDAVTNVETNDVGYDNAKASFPGAGFQMSRKRRRQEYGDETVENVEEEEQEEEEQIKEEDDDDAIEKTTMTSKMAEMTSWNHGTLTYLAGKGKLRSEPIGKMTTTTTTTALVPDKSLKAAPFRHRNSNKRRNEEDSESDSDVSDSADSGISSVSHSSSSFSSSSSSSPAKKPRL